MFFKVLKKDLKDSLGLNIFIFISMIVCSILIVASAIQIYASLSGFKNSYKKSNSSDVFIVTAKAVSNSEKRHAAVMDWFSQREDIKSFNCTEMISISSKNLQIKDILFSEQYALAGFPCYLIKQPKETNLIHSMKDCPFVVENGNIAINQTLSAYLKIYPGDKVRITTQMGNTYEFTVSHIFKDSSIYMFLRFVVSDDDYEFIKKESPVLLNNYEIQTTSFSDINIAQSIYSDYEKLEGLEPIVTHFNNVDFDGSKLLTSIVAVLCTGVAVFLIVIVFMTLRFTLASAIKKDECRLGTLRAIGVNSLSFKWMFTAKFIFFAFVSGIIGILVGIPLTNVLLDSVMYNILKPGPALELGIGIAVSILNVFFIILFILRSFKRIDKISIVSAIHGENRKERFTKIPGLELVKCKKMNIPFYLALTDILGRFKRYIFLTFSYLFGFAIILLMFQLKNTVISWDFLYKNQLFGKIDFYIDLPEQEYEKYALKTDGTIQGIYSLVNEELKNNNIPAQIETFTNSYATLLRDGKEYSCGLISGVSDVSKFTFKKGSYVPENPNEVAMNYLFAKKFGINKGDVVTVRYKKLSENKIDSYEVTDDFIVTGFTDVCSNAFVLIMASGVDDILPIQVESSQASSGRVFTSELFVPDSEKPFYIEKIKELYGDKNVKTKDEYFYEIWGSNSEMIFVFLRNCISILVLIVMILNTALYEQIFIEEEAADIAMLKTLGFTKKDIKIWQYFRILILVIAGFILGAIVTATAGNALMEVAIHVLMYASGFHLIVTPWVEYVVIPAVLISVISLVLIISFKNINSIFIWRIKDE